MVQYYDGSAWQSGSASYYDGSAWQTATAYYYDGSSWVQVGTSSTTTIEDFEDGSISGYALDTSAYTVVNATDMHNQYYLEGTVSSDSTGRAIVDTGPSVASGNTYRNEVELRADGTDAGALYGVQDETSLDGYLVWLGDSGSTLYLYLMQDGSFTELDSVAVTTSTNTQYIQELQWGSSGGLTARLLQQDGTELGSTAQVSDTTFGSGGIGFRVFNNPDTSGDATAWLDWIREL
ncbi:hypothetical protein HTZ84_22640 [Haloterrigena sp. SYSU A558-1]|uniref:Uncharacterized protein n=1 Tax=Haloterrigena gelatinilytica TaxID=2741724 RepID=A0ABX2LFN6_9EURY|nr:hypothetical protein [Haloterrigena gelatinilytica]NUC75067.1 hypothetical protein [Haloterrigena gelatinilytica]